MTLQASGSISISQINTEVGRASNAANTSLDALENGAGGGYPAINQNSASKPNGANPASMSEWYSYNHNAAPPNYNVTVQVIGNNGGSNEAAEVYYKIGAGAWTLLSSANLTGSYASFGTFSVASGSTVYFGVKKNGDFDNVAFGTGNGGAYSGYCGKVTTPSQVINGTTTYYLNVDAFNGGLITC